MSGTSSDDERLLASLPSEITSTFDKSELSAYLSLFKKYDTDGSGTIGPDELLQMLKELHFEGLSGTDCNKLIDDLDSDNSGQVDFDEFIQLLIMIQEDQGPEEGADRRVQRPCQG